MAVTTQEVMATRPVKHLISDQLWSRLTKRIVSDHPDIDAAMAARIMEQTLGFLQLCAISNHGGHSPSDMVDIGWHAFILYTSEYAEFCQRVAGRFIHHSPSDEEGVNYGTGNIARTVDAMHALNIHVDKELWPNAGDCTNYCTGDSCSGHKCTDTGLTP
jgi:hypothetical protein